jgi:hypothetical protein
MHIHEEVRDDGRERRTLVAWSIGRSDASRTTWNVDHASRHEDALGRWRRRGRGAPDGGIAGLDESMTRRIA